MADALTERRAKVAALAVGVVVFAAGVLAVNRLLVGVFYDDGLYAGLAAALGRGHGYVHPHLPGTPACIHYPPIYPLLLAPLFGTLAPDAAGFVAKLLNLGLATASTGLIAWHVTRACLLGDGVPWWAGAAAAGAGAVAVPVLATQAVLFSEPLFAMLLALAVISADRDRSLIAGIAAALATLTRTIGVASGAGIGLFLLRRGASRRDVIRALAPVTLAMLAWGLWVLKHRAGIDPALALNYGSYAEVLRQTGLGALGTSAPDLPRPLVGLTLAWLPWPPVRLALALVSGAVLAYGLVRLHRRSSIALVLVGYLAILAIWPYPADRFLWGVLPWLAVAWAAGVVGLLKRRPAVRVFTALLAGVTILGFATYETRGLTGKWWEGAAAAISTNFAQLLPALRDLPSDVVVATDDEALVWLYTGRTAVPLYLYGYRGAALVEPEPAEHRAYLERAGATHVVLASPSSASARQLRALIATYPEWLVVVGGWGGGRLLYEVRADR